MYYGEVVMGHNESFTSTSYIFKFDAVSVLPMKGVEKTHTHICVLNAQLSLRGVDSSHKN